MRIYIDNYSPANIMTHLGRLDAHFKTSSKHIKLYSSDGRYVMDNKQYYKLLTVDKPIIKRTNYNNSNMTLLIDSSHTIKEEVLSQVPLNHMMTEHTIFTYTLNNLILNVEGYYEHNDVTASTNNAFNIINSKNMTLEKYKNFVPIDFYFTLNDHELLINGVDNCLDNYFVKEALCTLLMGGQSPRIS